MRSESDVVNADEMILMLFVSRPAFYVLNMQGAEEGPKGTHIRSLLDLKTHLFTSRSSENFLCKSHTYSRLKKN